MLFKRRLSVDEYCTTRLNLLFSPQQADLWNSARLSSPDPVFRACAADTFLANMRAVHVELMALPIAKTYPIVIGMEASDAIDRYLDRTGNGELRPLVQEYNQAFGSSPSDGILIMAQLFADRVAGGRLAQSTVRQVYEDMYVALRSLYDDFKKIRLVAGQR